MYSLESFRINLSALDDGLTRFRFSVDDGFFEATDASDIRQGRAEVQLDVQRSGSVFTLDFHIEGTVVVPCDLCLDDMELPVEADSRLTAKFGEEESADGELMVVREDEGILDTAWFVYESIALAVPVKHVHAPGQCNVAMTQRLKELSAARSSDGADEGDADGNTDPRWAALKDFKV